MHETLDAPAPFAGTEIHTLPNGLKLIIKEDHRVPVVALQAWTRCGAIDESPNVYGISHGLEHMVFKGTPTRSAGEITRSIEAHGGNINAATQLETTHYYIDVPAHGATAALDVLADTILHPTFPQEELERERLVILEEIHRRDDSPDATLWDEFASHVFKNTPYGIKVIGSEKTVSGLTREDLFSYFSAHYVPEKINMVVVGDVRKKTLLPRLEKLFGNMKKQPAPATPAVKLDENRTESVDIKKPVQMTYFGMGFPTIGLGHPDSVALDMLADILGGSMSSRLFQSIREEKRLALSLSCDYMPFQQKGLFAFFGETLPETAERALDAIKKELVDLKRDPIRSDEVERAKARVKSEWVYGAETPHGQASSLGTLSVLGYLPLIGTYLKNVNAVTAADVMDVYERYLAKENFSITTISPQKPA
jgi:zinc protease